MNQAGRDDQEKPLSLVLFSGTDDKLTAAAVLAVGAAVMGRPVNIFLQYYALDALASPPGHWGRSSRNQAGTATTGQ